MSRTERARRQGAADPRDFWWLRSSPGDGVPPGHTHPSTPPGPTHHSTPVEEGGAGGRTRSRLREAGAEPAGRSCARPRESVDDTTELLQSRADQLLHR